MSIKIQTMVWDRYPGEDHELLLALKLADFCDDNGEHIFPSIETMAEKTRRSTRAVQYQIQSMVKIGWLIKVANSGGGRGRACEYRISADWINGAHIASLSSGSKGATNAPVEKDATASKKDAAGSTIDATDFAKGRSGLHLIHQKSPEEPSGNHQPAKRTPRVALHAELLNIDLPDTIPFAVWDMWCEHREAKSKDAPWTRPAARVSIKKLEMLAAVGQSPEVSVEEAVIRGWTGLFPVKAQSPIAGGATASNWHVSTGGVIERGKQLGVIQKDGEVFMRFKARVVKAAGPGKWMEAMLRDAARFGDEQYDALYSYFNDISRETVSRTEVA
ncbi:helix-turn-helix domain-containing protein [Paraburkholderia xenovorans]|uniref:helix-turn-helix domain-containing protein n=1 Tax=Paraburkholderia xenovorans TaxID=36873 RepID=UPI0038B8BA4D